MPATQTTRDLSYLEDADLTGTSYEDTEGDIWPREHVERVISAHCLDPAGYFAVEAPGQEEFLAWAVLDWLGY